MLLGKRLLKIKLMFLTRKASELLLSLEAPKDHPPSDCRASGWP